MQKTIIVHNNVPQKKSSPGGMGGWRGVKASLRIAYSNQKVT